MDTNPSSEERYFIDDDHLPPSFEMLWKEHISMLPEVPVNWKDSEVFKRFARKVYDIIQFDKYVQKIANLAYTEGLEEGNKEGWDSMKEEFIRVAKDL